MAQNGLPAPVNGFLQAIQPGIDAVKNNPVAKFLIGGAMNTAQDIGAGIAGNMTANARNTANDQAIAQAKQLGDQAAKEADPAKRAALFQQSQDLLNGVTQNTEDFKSTFSPDVQKNPLLRGAEAGLEIGTGADIAAHPVEVAKAGLNVIRHPIKTAQTILDTGISALKDPAEFVKGLPLDIENSFKLVKGENGLTQAGNRVLASQYKGAGKVVSNPAETAGKLADYGLTSPDAVANASAQVTGKNGIVNKLVTRAIKQTGVIDTKGLTDDAKALLDNAELIQPNTEKKILNVVTKSLEKSGKTPEGIVMNGGDPEQTLDMLRAWEGKANAKADPNTEAGQIAQVYRGLVDNLKNRLFVNSGADEAVVSGLLTPEDYTRLQKISPQLAEEVKNAKSVAELRSIQAPFVQGSKMVGIDERTANMGINPAQGLGVASTVISGNPGGLALAASQTRGGKNLIGNTLRFVGGANAGLPQIGLDAVGQAASKTLMPVTRGSVNNAIDNSSNNQNSNNQSHSEGIIASTSQPVKFSDIPQDVTQLKPDANGQYTIHSPQVITGSNGQPLAMSEQDYTNKKAQLQHDLGTLEVKYNPQVSAQKEAELQQLETTHSLSAKLQNNYDGAMKVSNAVVSANNLLASAPPSLLRDNPTIDKLSKAFDGKYATLAEQLQILQKYYPVMTDSILKSSSIDIAQSVLNQLNNQNAQDYYQTINGVTGNVPGVNLPAPTSQGLAPIPQAQGLPPIPQGDTGGADMRLPENLTHL